VAVGWSGYVVSLVEQFGVHLPDALTNAPLAQGAGTLITGTLAALVAGLFPITILGELVSIGTLLAFATVCIGVLVLRYTRPDLPRPFRVPAPCLVCVCGALVCLLMMVSLPPDTWVRLLGWTLVGPLIYVFYGFRHSELRKLGR